MFMDLALSVVPPILPKIIGSLVHGSDSITGKWVMIAYEDKHWEKERLYSIFDITSTRYGLSMGGQSYFPQKANDADTFPTKNRFHGGACRYEKNILYFHVYQEESSFAFYGEFKFDKYNRSSPTWFTGHYFVNGTKYSVKGMKVTRDLTKQHKVVNDGDVLAKIIPIIQGGKKRDIMFCSKCKMEILNKESRFCPSCGMATGTKGKKLKIKTLLIIVACAALFGLIVFLAWNHFGARNPINQVVAAFANQDHAEAIAILAEAASLAQGRQFVQAMLVLDTALVIR